MATCRNAKRRWVRPPRGASVLSLKFAAEILSGAGVHARAGPPGPALAALQHLRKKGRRGRRPRTGRSAPPPSRSFNIPSRRSRDRQEAVVFHRGPSLARGRSFLARCRAHGRRRSPCEAAPGQCSNGNRRAVRVQHRTPNVREGASNGSSRLPAWARRRPGRSQFRNAQNRANARPAISMRFILNVLF